MDVLVHNAGVLPAERRTTAHQAGTSRRQQGADTCVWLDGTTPAPASGLFWHDRRARPTHLVPWTRHSEAQRALTWDWCRAAAAIDP